MYEEFKVEKSNYREVFQEANPDFRKMNYQGWIEHSMSSYLNGDLIPGLTEIIFSMDINIFLNAARWLAKNFYNIFRDQTNLIAQSKIGSTLPNRSTMRFKLNLSAIDAMPIDSLPTHPANIIPSDFLIGYKSLPPEVANNIKRTLILMMSLYSSSHCRLKIFADRSNKSFLFKLIPFLYCSNVASDIRDVLIEFQDYPIFPSTVFGTVFAEHLLYYRALEIHDLFNAGLDKFFKHIDPSPFLGTGIFYDFPLHLYFENLRDRLSYNPKNISKLNIPCLFVPQERGFSGALFNHISNFHHLSTLEIALPFDFGRTNIIDFTKMISGLLALKHLSILSCFVDDKLAPGSNLLKDMLTSISNIPLEKLSLKNMLCNPNPYNTTHYALSSFDTYKKIIRDYSDAISSYIKLNPTIKVLDLSGSPFNKYDLKKIIEAARVTKPLNLKKLKMVNSYVNYGKTTIKDTIKKPDFQPPNLTVDLSSSYFISKRTLCPKPTSYLSNSRYASPSIR